MSYPATVFRILIASPSDVVDERDIAEQSIQHWNDINSPERQIVLLPVRWETHSAPSYGSRPQETINKQVADDCDLVIAIFWTRIGSPTGAADSGTIEEIERAAASGKPVMLYFSRSKHEPDSIDLDQLKKLREFKTKTLPNALVEHYSTQIEFRDKFAKQLEIQLRSLMQTKANPTDDSDTAVTNIEMRFADPESGADAGETLQITSTHVSISEFDQLPDYVPPEAPLPRGKSKSALTFDVVQPNRNFYRQYVTYFAQRLLLKPIRFWLKNDGIVGARDVYVEVTLSTDKGRLLAVPADDVPKRPPERNTFLAFDRNNYLLNPDGLLASATERWTTAFEIPALQPQRVVSPSVVVMVGATESCVIALEATVYADMLSIPSKKSLQIAVTAQSAVPSAKDFLQELLGADGTDPKGTGS